MTAALTDLAALEEPPSVDLPGLKRVRQSRRYPVWRTSHLFDEGVAVRVICWFPPNTDVVVVALFAGDKAQMGECVLQQRRYSCRRCDRAVALRNPR